MGQPPGICRQLRTTALPVHVHPLGHEPTGSLSKSKLGHGEGGGGGSGNGGGGGARPGGKGGGESAALRQR